ncbi:hypothetical protein [Leptolyngbya sp. FACHB-8]|uniref:hypothetical protein n=1 Tax=unclassified Leptolyngbya TaxID=2650499 RepID=UPI001689A60A|nr:hypothetical protein [Leptolyngbya sp. FACHB-8]MBD1912662.1 hypothetical protein [Leptolyngbya sp. FACHB-8]
MTPLLLHRFWSFIDDTQSSILLNLDDSSLENWLVNQFGSEHPLNGLEMDVLGDYVRSRLPLIRELAHTR